MVKRHGLRWGVGLLAILLVALAGATAFGYTPAGTQITNVAVAEYKVGDDVNTRTANSNIVYVTVKQIAKVEVSPLTPVTVEVSPHQTVQYSFTVTNTGNGSDSFLLSLVNSVGADKVVPGTLKLFRDHNGDGVIDAGDGEIQSNVAVGPVAAGESIHVIAQFKVEAGAQPPDTIAIDLQAESFHTEGVTDSSATITFKILTEAVLNATLKAQSDYVEDTSSVMPGGWVKYTVTLTNHGMVPTQENEALVTFEIPSDKVEFQAVSLSVNGSQEADPFIDGGKFTVSLPTINPGQTIQVSYIVDVDAQHPVGFITNQAEVKVGEREAVPTNEVRTRVLHDPQIALGYVNDSATYTVEPTRIGETKTFAFKVTNEGNGPDRILIEVEDDKKWPIGVYAADGVTALQKDGAKYIVGTLETNGTATVIVKVTVPTNVDTDNIRENVVKVEATSEAGAADGPLYATLKDIIGASLSLSVVGDDNKDGDPGAVVPYTIEITNNGPARDLFDLALQDVPPGYIVEFFDKDGNPISDISIDGSETEKVIVRVRIPSNAPAIDAADPAQSIEVRVTSQNNSGVYEDVGLRVGVNTITEITIAPDRSASAYRGSFTTQTVTLTNLGNHTIQVNLSTAVTGTRRLEYVFLKADDNSVIGTKQTVTLAAGASVNLRVRIDVPSQVAVGTVEAVRIVAEVDGTTVPDFATITTTVLGGELQLTKKATNLTTHETGENVEATPGEEVAYTITAKNISVGSLTDVVIYEKVPEHTTFEKAEGDTRYPNMEIEYSDDNGNTWGADPQDPDVVITDVKWSLKEDLLANAEVKVTLTVQVK